MTICILNKDPSLLQAYQNGYREPTNYIETMSAEDAAVERSQKKSRATLHAQEQDV